MFHTPYSEIIAVSTLGEAIANVEYKELKVEYYSDSFAGVCREIKQHQYKKRKEWRKQFRAVKTGVSHNHYKDMYKADSEITQPALH